MSWLTMKKNMNNNLEYYNVPFTMQELRLTLQHTKTSSLGEGTIFADVVKIAI